jgi:N-acetylmuramoyl-L-alanine amidase
MLNFLVGAQETRDGRDMRKTFALLMFLICLPLQAQQTSVDSLRLWAAPDHTRLVFDTSAPVEHSIFSLKKPDRLVIDIGNSKLKASLAGVAENDPLIKNLRSGVRERNGLRVVLDLRKKVKAKSFVLQPNRQYGYRLVVDLYQAEGNRQKKENKSIDQLKNEMRDVVIAIDAGHGGEDPGARGRYGTREKDVVLAISKKLAALIDKEKGMRAVMIRRGDYYLSLKKRTRLARDSKADLFISIHADAFRDRRVKGSSVYTLSRRGASSEAARWLADRENSADLVGGVELKDKDDVLASVLLDLSQTATQQASHEVAEKVLGEMRQVGKTHKRKVQRAGFVVLKSPDVPSILVETAFISNPDEEKRLKNPAHQRRLANSIMKGIRSYFRTNPPPGTLLANRAPRKHVISRGDTLAMIAKRYHVSVASIRDANNLSGDLVRVGQVLEIPRT